MIKKFNGNNILVVDKDWAYAIQLSDSLSFQGAKSFAAPSIAVAQKHLKQYDFDLVLCSHFLPDGFIHQLMDWSRKTLSSMPIFAVLGDCQPSEKRLLQKHSIAAFLEKSNALELFASISKLLFNFDDFCERLKEMSEEKGVLYELQCLGKKIPVKPLEVMNEGIFLYLEEVLEIGTVGILRISNFEKKEESFTVTGLMQGQFSGGQLLKVHEAYQATWIKVLKRLEDKQEDIKSFLNRASGK